jgi:hypothetical protein
MTASLTYVYCLVRSDRAPPLARAPAGLSGTGKLRLLDAGSGLWLVVTSAPPERYGEEAIDRGLKDLDWVSACAVAHEAVVEHFTRGRAVVPMKLFTLFRSDDRALQHVRGQRRRLDRVLQRVTGHQEWGVRILFDEVRALKDAEAAASRAAARAGTAGAGFLARKKALRDAGKVHAAEARKRADRVYAALAAVAADATRRAPQQGDPTAGRLVLDAAFLVRAGKAAAFRAAVRKAIRPLPESDQVTLSGPWPPYHFVAEAA